MSISSPIAPDRIAELQRHLLSGPTTRELTAAAYELEAIGKAQPSHVHARMLLDDYRAALKRDRARQSLDYLGSVHSYRFAPFSVWGSIVSVGLYVLAATTIAHEVFGLDILRSALAAIGLPIAVWVFFVLLAGVINLWEWIRDRLKKGDREA